MLNLFGRDQPLAILAEASTIGQLAHQQSAKQEIQLITEWLHEQRPPSGTVNKDFRCQKGASDTLERGLINVR